jgi:predicted NACHT family NTPase
MFGLDNLVDMLFDSAMENLSRNERVIQLLKRLKLDPDHPPADFAGVYQYALVEYGVGKPRPALEIFRQSEIQQLFREALEQNNPTKLLQHGEAFLADHPLQTDLQASNVDVRREFYAFAAVFIEVAKRTRTPAEMLAEQKLASLHRQIGTVQERLNRLPTIEGMRTEMARLVAPAYPALPQGESFGAEQCKAFALAQQMRGWFETLGFRLETHEVWQDDYFEWIINIPVRRGRYDRILVRGIDGEAGLRDVEALKQSVETHRTDEGWLVTARRISRAARDEVGKPENDGIGCYTLDELLDQDADFSGYLTWLEAEIQKRGIAEKYVPLACLKEEIDPDTKQRLGVSRYDDRDGWIDGYIDLWLDDPAKEHISVLGEFGTGKTWFALHYAWKALQRYREAQRRGLERPRLPLIIPLRDYAKAVSVESLFSEFFFRKHEIPIPGYSAFEQLNRMGKLLLIFDGFDEMAARVDRQEMINNFWELAKVVVPGAKVILTCRTEHFPEAKEGRALLNAELQASTRDLTGETPQFEVLELEKFNDEQIRQVLSHQAQPATVEQIMGNPQLLDLARRPVLTELILEALPDIEAGKPVDMSRVYLYAVRHKMERDIKEERTFTSMADKLYFMCELSWEMLSTDRMSINYREFPDRIRKLFGPAVQEEKDLDHWHYDMMGQTMLIRNAEGDYTPAHRSLLEFFVAYKFAAELGLLAPDFLELLQPGLNTEFSENTNERRCTWSSLFQQKLEEADSRNQEAILLEPESIVSLSLSFGSKPLTKTLLDLATPMIVLHEEIIHELFERIKIRPSSPENLISYVGGNLINILTRQNRSILSGRNLQETCIKGANFINVDLRNVNFSRAIIEKSLFLDSFSNVLSISYSPDGNLLAMGVAEGIIRILDSMTGNLISSFEGHSKWVRSVAFSPCGKMLASGSEDKTIRLWEVKTGKCLEILEGHSGVVASVDFHSSGKMIASGGHDKKIKLWSTSNSRCITTLDGGHTNRIWSVTFSPNGKYLASGSEDKDICIWDIENENLVRKMQGHEGWVFSLSFSNDSNLLASGDRAGLLKIWDVNKGDCVRTWNGHSGSVRAVEFHPQNKQILVSSGHDCSIKLWNIDSNKTTEILKEHSNWVRTVKFNPDGMSMASGGDDYTIKFWDLRTKSVVNELEGYTDRVKCLAFSGNNQILVCGHEDSRVSLWDSSSGALIREFRGHTNWIWSIAINVQNKLLASGSSDCSIKLWDISTGKCLRTLASGDDNSHSNRVTFLVFGLNKKLISSSDDQTLKIWDLATGKCLQTFYRENASVSSMSISPDCKILAIGWRDGLIQLREMISEQLIWEFSDEPHSVTSLNFSSNSKTLISCNECGIIKIWDIYKKSVTKTFEVRDEQVVLVGSFEHQNLIGIVAISAAERIEAFEIQGKKFVVPLQKTSGKLRAAALSKDGKILAGTNRRGVVDLWEVSTGRSVMVLNLPKPYEGMVIRDVKGLLPSQKTSLVALGAKEIP